MPLIILRTFPPGTTYEGGNSDITDAQVSALIDTINQYDPCGGRVSGCRRVSGGGRTLQEKFVLSK